MDITLANGRYVSTYESTLWICSLKANNVQVPNFWQLSPHLKTRWDGSIDVKEKISKYQKVAYFRAFSEVVISSLTDEKVRPYYTETYLLRKCVSGCDLGLDNANWVCGLDVRDFEVIFVKGKKLTTNPATRYKSHFRTVD